MYTEASQGNPLFERYYRELGLVPEEEWGTFMAQLKEELPATFRITGCRRWGVCRAGGGCRCVGCGCLVNSRSVGSSAVSLLQVLEKKYFRELQEIEVEGEKMPHPKPLPW